MLSLEELVRVMEDHEARYAYTGGSVRQSYICKCNKWSAGVIAVDLGAEIGMHHGHVSQMIIDKNKRTWWRLFRGKN